MNVLFNISKERQIGKKKNYQNQNKKGEAKIITLDIYETPSKKREADTSCSQIVKTFGSRRSRSWKIDSDVLKQPLKQECTMIYFTMRRGSVASLGCVNTGLGLRDVPLHIFCKAKVEVKVYTKGREALSVLWGGSEEVW